MKGWPDDLAEIIYIDRFGNAMTGLCARTLDGTNVCLRCRGHEFHHARTFDEVAKDEAFWYANSLGLIELAANRCSVADEYGLMLGDDVETQLDDA
jgi:S-adenosylmethionine hydrolase